MIKEPVKVAGAYEPMPVDVLKDRQIIIGELNRPLAARPPEARIGRAFRSH
jgi:hypothetical protein